jgi:hypothetical protein
MNTKVCFALLGCSVLSFAQPSVQSLLPLNGSGTTATFTSVYRHSGGVAKQYLAYLLVLPTPNIVQYTAKGSCLVEYNRISNGVRLINDAGDNWLGKLEGEPAGTPAGTVLTNNWCTVDTRNVRATAAGNDLTVTVPLTFFGTFTGQMGTFLQGFDVSGNYTGMTQFGNWTPNPIAAPKPGPYITSVTYPAYTLAPSKVVVDTGNTTGSSKIIFVNILVAEQILGGNVRCHIIYFPATKEIKLLNDAGTGYVTNNPAQNGYCAIGSFNGDVMFVSGTENDLHLNIPMVWNTPLLTKKLSVWANTFDNIGNLTHWLQ